MFLIRSREELTSPLRWQRFQCHKACLRCMAMRSAKPLCATACTLAMHHGNAARKLRPPGVA
eukprot:6190513-Amphidinium_carterae.1